MLAGRHPLVRNVRFVKTQDLDATVRVRPALERPSPKDLFRRLPVEILQVRHLLGEAREVSPIRRPDSVNICG